MVKGIKTVVLALIDAIDKRDLIFSLGAQDYILCPIIPGELLVRVKSCLSLDDIQNSGGKNSLTALENNQQNYVPGTDDIEKAHNDETELVQKTCQYLLNNLSLNHSLEILAHKMATNRNKLAQASKVVLGMGIRQWLIRERMQEAGRLCITTNFSIQEIGRRVGYSTPYSFSLAFKAYFKLSPRQYRKNNLV